MNAVVVVAAWNGEALITRCIDSLLGQRPCPRIIVVDDASTDDTIRLAGTRRPSARAAGGDLQVLQNSRNVGFTRTANVGLREALAENDGADVVVLLNQDVVVRPEWLAAMLDVFVSDPRAGAVGCKLYYPDGVTIQHAGGELARPRMLGSHRGHHQRDDHLTYEMLAPVEFVTGAALGLRVDALRAAGVFDEIFSPGYYEDVDLCVRLHERGWRVLYCPTAVAEHVESASFSSVFRRFALSHRNRLIFALRWMADASFRAAFVEAEAAALGTADASGLRHLGAAYLDALLMLPDAASARLPAAHRDAGVMEAVMECFIGLRNECLARARARRHRAG